VAKDVILLRLVPPLAEQMGAAYPELKENKALLKRPGKPKKNSFPRTLERGMANSR